MTEQAKIRLAWALALAFCIAVWAGVAHAIGEVL